MFFIGIASAVIAAVLFSLADRNLKFGERLHLFIKTSKSGVRFALFIVMAVAVGVASSLVGIAVLRITGSELLHQITSWAILGVGFVLLLNDTSPQDK